MFIEDSSSRKSKEILEGIKIRTFWGEKILISIVDLEAHSVLPSHDHPHEQCGYVLEGEIELTIDQETQVLQQGAVYMIPGNVTHSVIVGEYPAKVMDIFSPVREEYKY